MRCRGGRPGRVFARSLRMGPALFAPPLQPPPTVSVGNRVLVGVDTDVDLIVVALIVGLAAVGLAWSSFADRI